MKNEIHILNLDNIQLEIVKKRILHLHLRVRPPDGRVTVSAPQHTDLETIRLFCASKRDWIRKQQARIAKQIWKPSLKYLSGEQHDYLGQSYFLHVVEQKRPDNVVFQPERIILSVRPGASLKQREAILHRWYGQQLLDLVATQITRLEQIMQVQVRDLFVRKMKTRWGSCNPRKKSIRLNTELAKKPQEYIEYVLIHEMVHLLERKHNARFYGFMDKFLPEWKTLRKQLNKGCN